MKTRFIKLCSVIILCAIVLPADLASAISFVSEQQRQFMVLTKALALFTTAIAGAKAFSGIESLDKEAKKLVNELLPPPQTEELKRQVVKKPVPLTETSVNFNQCNDSLKTSSWGMVFQFTDPNSCLTFMNEISGSVFSEVEEKPTTPPIHATSQCDRGTLCLDSPTAGRWSWKVPQNNITTIYWQYFANTSSPNLGLYFGEQYTGQKNAECNFCGGNYGCTGGGGTPWNDWCYGTCGSVLPTSPSSVCSLQIIEYNDAQSGL